MAIIVSFSPLLYRLKKNLNASKPSNQTKGLGGSIDCRDKKLYLEHGIKRIPQCSHMTQCYYHRGTNAVKYHEDVLSSQPL